MMSKLLHTILVFILATLAFGQNVVISHPPPGTSVKPNEHVRVQIARPVRAFLEPGFLVLTFTGFT